MHPAELHPVEHHEKLELLLRRAQDQNPLGLRLGTMFEDPKALHLATSVPAPKRERSVVIIGRRAGQDQQSFRKCRQIPDPHSIAERKPIPLGCLLSAAFVPE